jgi:hypothetical protein
MSKETNSSSTEDWKIETIEDDPLISTCLLSQCRGCTLCQNAQVVEASARIQDLANELEDYQSLIDAATLELQHLLELRRLLCRHFWQPQLGRLLCPRCGKTQQA